MIYLLWMVLDVYTLRFTIRKVKTVSFSRPRELCNINVKMALGRMSGLVGIVLFIWMKRMVSYEGDVTFVSTVEDYYVVDADDIEDAEDKLMEAVKFNYPDARSIIVENIAEISKISS